MNRLYKSEKDKVFEGVCGGIGEYLNVDPVIIRLMWVVLVIFGGTGIVAYLIAMLIIPRQPASGSEEVQAEPDVAPETYSNRFWGLIMIVAGILLLFGIVGPIAGLFAGIAMAMGHVLWPLLVIGLGLYLYFNQSEDSKSSLDGIFPPGKKLYKSRSDRKISGVCGGIGQYFDFDSNIIRIFWAVATLGSFGFGILAYAALAIFLDESD
jgi:phage shock protein C